MKKSLYFSFALLLIIASCDREDSYVAPSIDVDLENYISSESFKSLGIDVSSLDLTNYKKTASKSFKEVLYVPLLGNKNKFVLGFVTDDKSYRSILADVESSTKFDRLSQKITDKQLNADFKFSSPGEDITFKIVDSKLFTGKQSDVPQSGKTTHCSTMLDVYACAATSIDQMGPVAYAMCLVEMPICLAVELADCWLGNCGSPGSPQVPQP